MVIILTSVFGILLLSTATSPILSTTSIPLISFCRKTPYLSSCGEKFSDVVTTIDSHQPPFYTALWSNCPNMRFVGQSWKQLSSD